MTTEDPADTSTMTTTPKKRKQGNDLLLWVFVLAQELGAVVLAVWGVSFIGLLVGVIDEDTLPATENWVVLVVGLGLFTLGFFGEQGSSGAAQREATVAQREIDVVQRDAEFAQREIDVTQREKQVSIAQREIDVTLRERRVTKQNRQMTAVAVISAAACVMAGRRR